MNLRAVLRDVFVGDELRRDLRISTLANPSATLGETLAAIEAFGGDLYIGSGGSTASGKTISPATALRMIAVYACARVLSEDVGQLPLHLFRKRADATGRRVRERLHEEDDTRARVLGEEPNPEITAQTLWEIATGHQQLWGNAYLNVVFGADGDVAELWPLPPESTAPILDRVGRLVGYGTLLPNGQTAFLFPAEVLHLRAFGTGHVGIPPIGVARQAIGIAVSAEEYAGRFWANDATAGTVYSTDKPISDAEYERARRRYEARHRGVANAHLVAFLDNGMKPVNVTTPAKDAQFIETRKFQVREIARLFRVPPYKIADLEAGSVSYASVEVQQLDYLQTSLNPWLKRIETALKRQLFATTRDRADGIFAEFERAAILQGDFKTTAQALSAAVSAGILTRNEARERLNLAPAAGGDELATSPPAPPADEPPEATPPEAVE